jgi:hypothetical protein
MFFFELGTKIMRTILLVVSAYGRSMALAALLVGCVSHTTAAAKSNVELNRLRFEKIVTERERLHSGKVSIVGLDESESFKRGKSHRNAEEISEHLLFDYSRGLVRQEKTLTNTSVVNSVTGVKGPLHETVVFGLDGCYNVQVEAKQIVVGPPRQSAHVLDMRAIGFLSFQDILSKSQFSVLLPSYLRGVELGNIEFGEVSDKGFTPISLTYSLRENNPNAKDAKRTVWVDGARQWIPVRLEESHNKNADKGEYDPDWGTPHSVTVTEWQMRQDIWVPMSTTAEYTAELGDVKQKSRFVFSFEWHDVNQLVSDDDFSIKTLDVPKGSHVIEDGRLKPGAVIMTQHPAVPDGATLRKIQEANGRKPSTPPRLVSSQLVWISGGMILVILIGCLSIFIFSRRTVS